MTSPVLYFGLGVDGKSMGLCPLSCVFLFFKVFHVPTCIFHGSLIVPFIYDSQVSSLTNENLKYQTCELFVPL